MVAGEAETMVEEEVAAARRDSEGRKKGFHSRAWVFSLGARRRSFS